MFRGETSSDAPVDIEGRMQVLSDLPERGEGIPTPYGAWRAIITPTHKLAVSYDGEVRLLTDLQNDPYELNNLANTQEAAALQGDLLAALRNIGKGTGDPFPDPVTPAPGGP